MGTLHSMASQHHTITVTSADCPDPQPPSFDCVAASKTKQLDAQVAQVKVIMNDNINVMLENGEKIQDLEQNANTLSNEARAFRTTARSTKRALCIRDAKMNILLGFLTILLILLLVGMIWQFFAPFIQSM